MKNKVTIILPVSRATFLDKVFAALEFLDCDSSNTSLIVIVDGDDNLFLDARNRTEFSKFSSRLCVRYTSKLEKSENNIFIRRDRIADIHRQIKQYIGDCDFIMGIEDDTVFPDFTLKLFLEDYVLNPHMGFVEGIELGRWSYPYIGAWRIDDIYETKKITSILPEDDSESLAEIDAGGFYCFLTRRETYMGHEFDTFEDNSLGPDINFGISLRRKGYSNFIDWHINCTHMSESGNIVLGKDTPKRLTFMKKNEYWRYYKQ